MGIIKTAFAEALGIKNSKPKIIRYNSKINKTIIITLENASVARRIYKNIKEIFKDMGINIDILTGSTTKKEKELIYKDRTKNDV